MTRVGSRRTIVRITLGSWDGEKSRHTGCLSYSYLELQLSMVRPSWSVRSSSTPASSANRRGFSDASAREVWPPLDRGCPGFGKPQGTEHCRPAVDRRSQLPSEGVSEHDHD